MFIYILLSVVFTQDIYPYAILKKVSIVVLIKIIKNIVTMPKKNIWAKVWYIKVKSNMKKNIWAKVWYIKVKSNILQPLAIKC